MTAFGELRSYSEWKTAGWQVRQGEECKRFNGEGKALFSKDQCDPVAKPRGLSFNQALPENGTFQQKQLLPGSRQQMLKKERTKLLTIQEKQRQILKDKENVLIDKDILKDLLEVLDIDEEHPIAQTAKRVQVEQEIQEKYKELYGQTLQKGTPVGNGWGFIRVPDSLLPNANMQRRDERPKTVKEADWHFQNELRKAQAFTEKAQKERQEKKGKPYPFPLAFKSPDLI